MAARKRSLDDTIDYEVPPAVARGMHATSPSVPTGGEVGESAFDATRPGVGVDRQRPPQAIRTGPKTLARPLSALVVLADPLQRARLGSALVRARCRVFPLDAIAKLEAHPELHGVDVLVAELDDDVEVTALAIVRRRAPATALLGLTTRPKVLERALAKLAFPHAELLPPSVAVPDLLAALERVTGG